MAGRKRVLDPVTIEKAEKILEEVIYGVDLKADVPDAFNGESVALVPGSTSESCDMLVFREGKWVRTRDRRNTTTADLAKVDSHTLGMEQVMARAKENDSVLDEMLKMFFTPGQKDSLVRCMQSLSSKVSHRLSANDVEMLCRAGIIRKLCCRESTPSFALYNFKVPKKDPREARCITDCRELNEAMSKENIFPEVDMNIPELHAVMDAAAMYAIGWSVDANAYFFQFKMQGSAAKAFPIKTANMRGIFDTYYVERLPMGLCLAPAIAQRTSNLITTAVQKRIASESLSATVTAWVDNFCVFANDVETAEKVMEMLLEELRLVNIAVKEVDKSGEFLGLIKEKGGLALNKKFKEKLAALIDKALVSSLSKNDQQVLAGNLMWLNHTVARIPLACTPHTLAWLRSLGNDTVAVNIDVKSKEELSFWKSKITTIYYTPPLATQTKLKNTWSDATPTKIAVVIGNAVFIAQSQVPYKIALMEAIAAAWGVLLSEKRTNAFIDNQSVAYAFAKGHCSSDEINKVLSNMYKFESAEGSITWVPSGDQVADAPTRDLPTVPEDQFVFTAKHQWKALKSAFFRQGNPV